MRALEAPRFNSGTQSIVMVQMFKSVKFSFEKLVLDCFKAWGVVSNEFTVSSRDSAHDFLA